MGPARAHRSTSSSPGGRLPSCAAGRTSCHTTSVKSRPKSSAIDLSSPTRGSRRASRRKPSFAGYSSASPRPASISELGVPPDIAGGIAVDPLLRRARWPVLRRLGFHPGGDERSAFRGTGLEYSDVREYQAGDDPCTIEWNITARSDRPYVRESLPDRGLDAWLLIDVSRSLDWGTARCLKRQLAIEFSAVVGQLLIGRGNRVGALLFDERVRSIIPPSAGRTALLQLIARISRAAEQPADGSTDLGRALTEAGRLIRRPSLMVILTDFMTPGGWQQPLSALAIRHEVIASWGTDPRERGTPPCGHVSGSPRAPTARPSEPISSGLGPPSPS